MPDEAAFNKKLKEQAAQTLFQLIWGWVEKLGETAWEETAISEALERYTDTYCDRHGSVKVLGMSGPIPLNQIYTAVKVVSPTYLGQFTNPDEMQKAFLAAGRKHLPLAGGSSHDGMELANSTSTLNVLGAPGSGKSTFLRRIGIEAMLVKGPGLLGRFLVKLGLRYDQARIPVLVELRTFRQSPVELEAAIVEEFSTCGFPKSPRFVKEALNHGKLLVLLDGLDEVPAGMQNEVIDHVSGFVTKYGKLGPSGNRFVTSCRTAHYKNAFKQFTDVVLADFNDEQIRMFAKNWFAGLHHKQAATADRFFEAISSAHNAGAMELARTPLLLTFLCLTYAHGQALPPTRATLYRRALDLLLREWAAERRVHSGPIHQDFHADLETDMLAELAHGLFREERFFFDRARVTDHIRDFMGRQLNTPRTLDSDRILEAIEVQQGLVVRRADNVYSFSHLTIQEYLTAKKIWDEGEEAWKAIVDTHLFESRWRVVFELMAGLGDPDRLFKIMALRISRHLGEACRQHDDMRRVMKWVCRRAVPDAGLLPREAAANRLGLLGVLFAVAGQPGRFDQSALPPLLSEVATALDQETGTFIDSLRATFVKTVERPVERPRTPIRIHRGESIDFNETPAERDAALEAYKRAREREILTNQERRTKLIHDFLAKKVCRQTSDTTPALATASAYPSLAKPQEVVSEVLAIVNSVALFRDRQRDLIHESLSAWELVVRCKRSTYRLTAAVWDETCRSIMNDDYGTSG